MGIVGEFLSKLLNEYEEILSQNPDLRTRPCPDNEFTGSFRESLDNVNDIPSAIKWWERESQDKLSPMERGYQIYLLLHKLDYILSDKSIVRHKIAQGEYITIGHRWWNHYARCIGNKAPLDGSPLSIYSGFPHLRHIKCEEDELI